MSTSERRMILDTAARLFDEHCNRKVLDAVALGEWPEALWRAAREAGLTTASGAAVKGEMELSDAYASLRAAGRYAAPLPLAELLLSHQVLAENGCEADDEAITSLVFVPDSSLLHWDGERLSGTLSRVWFGRHLQGLVVACGVVPNTSAKADTPKLLWIPKLTAKITPKMNAAGEPCDNLVIKATPAKVLNNQIPILETLALARAVQMAGAMEAALEMAVGYALERNQFGRPIASFQAIQQQLAFATAEAAAATCAAEAGLNSMGTPLLPTAAAVAKARVGEAVGPVSAIAHQVQGAMGFTYEYWLHYLTRRLWVWRDEYGHEAHWQARLGRSVARLGADQCWSFIVDPEPIPTA